MTTRLKFRDTPSRTRDGTRKSLVAVFGGSDDGHSYTSERDADGSLRIYRIGSDDLPSSVVVQDSDTVVAKRQAELFKRINAANKTFWDAERAKQVVR